MSVPRLHDPGSIRFATIHATASPFGRDDRAHQISAWDTATFGQVSYHHVIELDGRVVQTLRHDQVGAHVRGHNTGNIGIAYVGGLGRDRKPADTRTPAQRRAMALLAQQLRGLHPGILIRGHRDWSPDRDGNGRVDRYEWLKACPCFDVADWLREIGR